MGNLCRHSDLFFNSFSEIPPTTASAPAQVHRSIISALVDCCGDRDEATRKFACFAVGNASFHSAALYQYLKPAVPLLVQALFDSEEKTRANAAGALGNFVRNSADLCGDIVAHHAPAKLLQVATNDQAINPRRIALFSLGNVCVYRVCRVSLSSLRPPLDQQLRALEASLGDSTARKYIVRLRQKLQAPANAASKQLKY